jgi:hypothetical protein
LIRRFGRIRGFALRVVEGVDRQAILRADVVALTHALDRVMTFPERLQQLIVGNLVRVEHHQYHVGMAGTPRADLLVGRIGGAASRVADRGDVTAIAEFPEFAFRTLKQPSPNTACSRPLGIRRLQPATVDEMADRGRDRRGASRQRLADARQCGGLAHEQRG